MSMAWITEDADGCLLTVKAVPRASRSELSGVEARGLRVRLQAPPVDGKANAALVELLAGALDVPRRAVTVVAGATGRLKRVRVAGLCAAAIRTRLGITNH